jgi:hypothetical protein
MHRWFFLTYNDALEINFKIIILDCAYLYKDITDHLYKYGNKEHCNETLIVSRREFDFLKTFMDEYRIEPNSIGKE